MESSVLLRFARPGGTHCRNFVALLDVLDRHFADDLRVYVWGNLFVYYVRGDKRKHVERPR